MDTQTELQRIQSLLLDQISSAVSRRDVAAIAALSGLAKECEALETEFTSLNRRVETIKSALNGSWVSSMTAHKLTYSVDASTTHEAAGAQARNEWVVESSAGHLFTQHRKRYQAARGQSRQWRSRTNS
jgi:hypothetical protein